MAVPESSTLTASVPSKRAFNDVASLDDDASVKKYNEGNKRFGSGKRLKRPTKRERGGGITNEHVLNRELLDLMANASIDPDAVEFKVPEQEEVDVTITALSSTGEGLGQVNGQSSQIFVVPFAIPGDVVRVKAYKNNESAKVPHTAADFISVVKPSQERDDTLIGCKYFAKCGGCQFQMLPYQKQLDRKRVVLQTAFKHFSELPPELIPDVHETHASPRQYGYRTKLTPHFDHPPGKARRKDGHFESTPSIGFNRKDTGKVMDIEQCPIGSSAINHGMKRERERVTKDLEKYKKAVTILLRESTESRVPIGSEDTSSLPRYDEESETLFQQRGGHILGQKCLSDWNVTVHDYVGDYKMSSYASSFFQNNNSILPGFIDYISQQVTGLNGPTSTSSNGDLSSIFKTRYRNLIDAYCGSGLFSVMLASHFDRTIGIDVDKRGTDVAKANMEQNAHLLPTRTERRSSSSATLQQTGQDSSDTNWHVYENVQSQSVGFLAASAEHLFASVQDFDPQETVVILDPPRKGCDSGFLKQLLDFAPEKIIYVSCNVHTQARDIGWLLRGGLDGKHGKPLGDLDERLYELDSLKPFDFFPQSAHVEGVAVLSKRANRTTSTHTTPAQAEPATGKGAFVSLSNQDDP